MTSEMAEQQKPPGNRREDGERVEKKPLDRDLARRGFWLQDVDDVDGERLRSSPSCGGRARQSHLSRGESEPCNARITRRMPLPFGTRNHRAIGERHFAVDDRSRPTRRSSQMRLLRD